MQTTVRQALRRDEPGIQRVRRAVRENRLTSCVIGDAEVTDRIERTGRGWEVVDDAFYRRAGWRCRSTLPGGELPFDGDAAGTDGAVGRR
jgi:hypothetical protein